MTNQKESRHTPKLQLESRETCTGSTTIHLMGDRTNYLFETDDNQLAENIIRTVNSHDALLAVAKRSLEVANAWLEENVHEDQSDAIEFKEMIEKAIQQAEGK